MNRSRLISFGICAAAILFACSPDPGPFFKTLALPENQPAFNRGQLGLLTPTLSKENELIAFRVLSGVKIPDKDSQAGSGKESDVNPNAPPEGAQVWNEARKAIADPPVRGYINIYRGSGAPPDSYVYFENCLSDAFETAAHTLANRRTAYASPAALKAWVSAQDQVFENCSADKPVYPDPLPASSSALERADRDYQIAASHFYALDLPEAEKRFRAIAADGSSPWRPVGNYLIARTLLREATLRHNAAAEPLARQQLEKIVNDPSSGNLAASARGLLQHFDAVHHPDREFAAFSKQLLLPVPQDLQRTLDQGKYLLVSTAFAKARSAQTLPEPLDWVLTLEAENKDHALEQWQARRSLPWLTLSLMFAAGQDANAAELIQEGDRLPPDSPAFGTAAYNAIRLRMERGETDPPRKQLDKLLTRKNDPVSLVNGWRSERIRLATGFDDLLRWAPRTPLDPWQTGDTAPVLAEDSAYMLNYRTPLAKLAEASHSARLPAWSAADVALAAWTRAFMLNDLRTAQDVATVVSKAYAKWAANLRMQGSPDAAQLRFQTALFVALHHEIQPLVTVDYKSSLTDGSGGSWWCPVEAVKPTDPNNNESTVSWRLPVSFTPPSAVISGPENKKAAEEIANLGKLGTAQSFLAPIIFDWAKSHPNDALVPQALHRLVVVVRYGCGDEQNGRISKAAFDLLHTRYPKSEWTRQTPYWFK